MLLPLNLQFDPLSHVLFTLSCTQNSNFFLFSCLSCFVWKHSSISLLFFLFSTCLPLSLVSVCVLLVLLYPVSVLLLPFPMYQSILWLNSSRFVWIHSLFLSLKMSWIMPSFFLLLISFLRRCSSCFVLLLPFFRVNETFESQSGKRKSRIGTRNFLTEEKETVLGCLKVRRMNAWVRQRPAKPIRIWREVEVYWEIE